MFIALYVKMALLYFNRFTIGSELNSLNIFAEGVLKSANDNIRATRFWSLDILSRFNHRSLKFCPCITSKASKPKVHNVIM